MPSTSVESPKAKTWVDVESAGSTSPPPRVGPYPDTLDASAVETMAAESSWEFHVGWACLVRAATPAACGAAMDVPDKVLASVPEPTRAELMDTPGAATLGRRAESPLRGPAEVKEP